MPKSARDMRTVASAFMGSPAVISSYSLPIRRKQWPFSRNALEMVGASGIEANAGPGHEIFHRVGYQNLCRLRQGCDPRGGMHRNAADVVAHEFAFAGVQAGAHVD